MKWPIAQTFRKQPLNISLFYQISSFYISTVHTFLWFAHLCPKQHNGRNLRCSARVSALGQKDPIITKDFRSISAYLKGIFYNLRWKTKICPALASPFSMPRMVLPKIVGCVVDDDDDDDDDDHGLISFAKSCSESICSNFPSFI